MNYLSLNKVDQYEPDGTAVRAVLSERFHLHQVIRLDYWYGIIIFAGVSMLSKTH